MEFIQGISQNQLFLMNLDGRVSQDSWARIIDLFVNLMDLEKLGFKDVLNKEGRPPFHSSVLLKLLLYGYNKNIRSSRKLQKACEVNLEVIWLLNGLKPSARTIAYFRKKSSKAIKNLMNEFVHILQEWDLIGGQTIAIDSFKIRAQNSLKNNFNQKKIDRHIEYIDNKIEQYIEILEQNDSLNDIEQGSCNC